MNRSHSLGSLGERLVKEQLKDQGFTVLAQNYKKFFGEVDLIAQKKDLLVFVEVKMRRNPLFDLTSLITNSKQKKIILAAKDFLATHNIVDKICRFDVALIDVTNNNTHITYIPNAFEGE